VNADETKGVALAIERPRPSRVLTPLGLAVCLSLFGDLALYASLVTRLDALGLGLGGAGIMLSVHRLIRIPGNPLAGVLLDRCGRRRSFILGMVLAVLSTAGYGLVRGFWPFLISRLAWGVAWILINVTGMTMVLDVSRPANRGRLTGTYNAWMLLGLAMGPLAGGFLVDVLGFQMAMLTCAGITVVGLAIAAVSLPETNPSANRQAAGGTRQTSNPRRRPSVVKWQEIQTWLRVNRGLVTASSLYMIAQFAGDGIALSTISLLLQERFGESVTLGRLALGVATAGGVLLALRSLVAGAVGPLAGLWSDRRAGRWAVILSSLVLGIFGFGLLAFAASLPGIVLGVTLGAVSAGAALATLAATVGDTTPPGKQGAVMGAYAAAGDVGSTTGPLLAFALAAVVDVRWVYLFCAAVFVLGLWLGWRNAHGR
jgi:MFS family permease